ncbi:MAG: DNA-directed DNA polymerase alpha subunit pol12 [Cirrosporium novae-zelandiae]|nr:MAG: DNA-directed DNA polymerase alpha subunit pol12 [Cirrosporium novae-zelandiae]
MASTTEEIINLFGPSASNSIPPEVMSELQSILRIHGISAQELFYKWESYCLKMGSEETKLNLDTARAFKQDVQDTLERESKGRANARHNERRNGPTATPRTITKNNNGDVFGMLDGLVPNTPHSGNRISSTKRKAGFETPSASKASRAALVASPHDAKTLSRNPDDTFNGQPPSAFKDRTNSGQVIEALNDQLPMPKPPIAPAPEPRIRLTANTDLKKFGYKPMAMHLSEASEVLDDRIDEFMSIIQAHHGLEDSAFGNAASQSTSEIVTVGRIASDSIDGKLNAASLVLEVSRRTGAGLRVPLRVDKLPAYEFFPGQIVALRGINPASDYFTVSEILTVPLLPPAASLPKSLDAVNERLHGDMSESSQPLQILIASGPYTADDNLAFEPLQALCEKASEVYVDALVLTGPFLDLEHPLLATGDIDLPEIAGIDPDDATLSTVFRHLIGSMLKRLAESVPSITIILIPSTRDAISKHVSWPQESFIRKDLGLPKQAKPVSNPVTLSFNEFAVGISSQDILYELRRSEVIGGKPSESNVLARLPRHIIEQRHFFPLFPPMARADLPKSGIENGVAMGSMLDTSYLKLGEWLRVRPDILITPSALSPFAKVVESVLVINPGHLSKRRGPGTYAQLTVNAREVTDEERQAGKMVGHKMYERTRVDIIRI